MTEEIRMTVREQAENAVKLHGVGRVLQAQSAWAEVAEFSPSEEVEMMAREVVRMYSANATDQVIWLAVSGFFATLSRHEDGRGL